MILSYLEALVSQSLAVGGGVAFWFMFAAPLMAALTALVPPILFVTFALVRVQLATEVLGLGY